MPIPWVVSYQQAEVLQKIYSLLLFCFKTQVSILPLSCSINSSVARALERKRETQDSFSSLPEVIQTHVSHEGPLTARLFWQMEKLFPNLPVEAVLLSKKKKKVNMHKESKKMEQGSVVMGLIWVVPALPPRTAFSMFSIDYLVFQRFMPNPVFYICSSWKEEGEGSFCGGKTLGIYTCLALYSAYERIGRPTVRGMKGNRGLTKVATLLHQVLLLVLENACKLLIAVLLILLLPNQRMRVGSSGREKYL